MKTVILASLFAIALRAQDPVQLIPQPANIGVWSVVQGAQAARQRTANLYLQGRPAEIALNFPAVRQPSAPVILRGRMPAGSGVCSVPLLAANADANDPGIAASPGGSAVPIRQAHLPAPPCQ